MTRVLLVGMMGTGKTTVGRALSARTGWPYLDNDELLQRACGRTAPELLAAEGEPALRAAESAALTLVLGMPGPLISGVAGGVVLDPADRARLVAGDASVIWLRATVATLVHRVGSGAGRSWLGDDPASALARLAATRDPLYAEVADQVIDVDTGSPDELAARISLAD